MRELISPFDERVRAAHPLAGRLDNLHGKRLSLFSISKPKSDEFLNELGEILTVEYGALVSYARKPTFAAPAPRETIEEVARDSDAVIEALAD